MRSARHRLNAGYVLEYTTRVLLPYVKLIIYCSYQLYIFLLSRYNKWLNRQVRTPSDKSDKQLSGANLLADFQNVWVALATTAAAKYEADRSEHALLQHLNAVGGDTYLQPTQLANSDSDIAKASLDAHIKKVQADQLNAISLQQIQALVAADNALYKGKRVRVAMLQKNNQSVESVWYNPQTGYTNSPLKYGRVSGFIDEVVLDRNILVLKPTLKTRLLAGALHYYVIYPISPATVTPAVSIEFI